jgi:SAM-dependent methyltransferase
MTNITDHSNYTVEQYIKEFAKNQCYDGMKVLDAGSGDSPFRKYFSDCIYHTVDNYGVHTYKCDLHNLIIGNNEYDVIICTEVLEHVMSPSRVISEFHRVLKPGGKLVMTVPQCYGVHSNENYFNFLKGGVKLLLERNKFQVVEIKPLGGIFGLIGKITRVMPWYIYRQYFGDNYKLTLKSIILVPIFVMVFPVCRYIIPLVCYVLDKIDIKKDWTVNYGCYAVKV